MQNYFIIPGLGNSGPAHWQTWFEKSGANFQRIHQRDWETPNCIDWIRTIDAALANDDPASLVLIGHSLGCAAIVHWAARYGKIIKGALLVAPSDIEAPHYTFPVTGFAPLPKQKINFKTIVVASRDDVWVSMDRAKAFADCWGSELIDIGNAGHINAQSGYGEWPAGLGILSTL